VKPNINSLIDKAKRNFTYNNVKRLVLIIILVSSAVIGVTYLPRQVRSELSGFEILMTGSDEFEILNQVDIRVDGRWRNGLFASRPNFRGAIEISTYEFTIDNNNVDISFYTSKEYPLLQGLSSDRELIYRLPDPNPFILSPIRHSLGFLNTDRQFSAIVIIKMAETQDGFSSFLADRLIVAPAADLYSAIEIIRSKEILLSPLGGAYRLQMIKCPDPDSSVCSCELCV